MKVLLLTVDSVRKDRLSCYGYERETTPFLDSLSTRCLTYHNAYSASCHTREAVPPILTGKRPEACLRRYQIDAETLPQTLRADGDVTTVGITAGPFLGRANNYDRGFDRFETAYEWDGNRFTMGLEYLVEILANKHFRPGEAVTDRVVSALAESDADDLFVWAHYMDVHAPYNRFETWRWGTEVSPRKIQWVFRKAKYAPDSLTQAEVDLLNDCYDNSLRELDEVLRSLFRRIDDDVNVVLASDHGELLGDNDAFAHRRGHLCDELVTIPLFVRNGDRVTSRRPVSTLNIAPTIADWFGVDFETPRAPLESSAVEQIEASTRMPIRGQRRKIHPTVQAGGE